LFLILIIGATSGIGTETTRILALRGAHVVMGVRNVSAGATVKSEISKEIPDAQIDVLELDLSSMASVRKFASDFKAMNLPLNILMSDNSFIWNLLLSTNFFLI
jgi:WW domain-containing oxidoreductase